MSLAARRSITQQIVAALAHDGRASIEALSRETKHPRSLVQQILGSMENDGIQVRGIVHPSVFGLNAYAHLFIRPKASPTEAAEALSHFDCIPFISLSAGEYPLVAEIRVKDRQELSKYINVLRQLEEIADVVASEYTEILKDALAPTKPFISAAVDETDLQLLAEIQKDGRASYTYLASAVSLSAAAVRARLLRLLDTGVVHIGIRRKPMQNLYQAGVAIRIAGVAENVKAALLANPTVYYLATVIGEWAFVATIQAEGTAKLSQAIDTIHRIPGVDSLETWLHLDLVKESYTYSPDSAPVISEPSQQKGVLS